jgi:glucose-1-phosphate thymidylyltransferase
MTNSDQNHKPSISRATWGVVPAAGAASRMQPLALSKELLPVGGRVERGIERPRAISEYLVERLIRGGATKICFVVSPSKADIMQYYGSREWGADIIYTTQPRPSGLCDAIFRAAPLIGAQDRVLIGLPDTIWYPEDGFAHIHQDALSLLLFPVEHPECFDAVVTTDGGEVVEIQVKHAHPSSCWIWGAIGMPGSIFQQLYALWQAPERRDEYLGTLINAWIASGGTATGVQWGREYIDAGTLEGYRAAVQRLRESSCAHEANFTSNIEEEQANVFSSFSD